MILPCIKDKCLKYPVCKYKKAIVDCKELEAYYWDRRQFHTKEEVWQNIKRELPSITIRGYFESPMQRK